MNRKIFLSALAAATALVAPAMAQSFPERPVTIVVPYSPGGNSDVFARHLATDLQKLWDKPVVVENRPGAGSMIGTAHVSQANPDGHTILLTTSAYVTAPAVYDELPYDPLTGLTPIGKVGYVAYMLVGGADMEAKTLEEFIEAAKEQPMIAATAGLGTTTHFAIEKFMAETGLDMTVVHYGGGGDALVSLLSGDSDIYTTSVAVSADNIRSGAITAYAVMGDAGVSALPDVPTTTSLGFDDLNVAQWLGVFTPAGVSPEIAAKLNADINAVISTEDFRQRVAAIDVTVEQTTLEQFSDLIASEIVMWGELAEERNITAE
jgi:tripartite-type tricarboxylate transporter receptor subunit TctC